MGKTGLSLVFNDEFDKLFISGNTNSELAHETTNGVQNEYLKVLESKTTAVYGDYGKYINADVSKSLFVFGGAFNGQENITVDALRDFGIKTEFLGRVPLVFNLQKLSIDSMRAALEESALLAKYLKLFKDSKKDRVVAEIMPHIERAHEKNTLGIRIINALLHQYFINGGKLPEAVASKTTFQETLSLEIA
jgi:ATP-dependent protease Clp ATPase subunit